MRKKFRIFKFHFVYPEIQLSIMFHFMAFFVFQFAMALYFIMLVMEDNFYDFIFGIEFDLMTALSIVSVLVLILLYCLNLTMRIAGPIYRLESHLERLRNEDIIEELKFREKDYYNSLEKEFNRFISHIIFRCRKKN